MKKIAFLLIFATPLLSFQNPPQQEKQIEEEVSANEDLMREHGLLNRVLLIYQEIVTRIETRQEFPIDTLVNAARIIRNFVEDYHEKLEEDFIFPQFEKRGKQKELIRILRDQHLAGRNLTDYILTHAKQSELNDDVQRLILADYIKLFIRMYRPHEAREDTILFPEFKELISKKEYDKLGDIFEERETRLFGKGGFEKMVNEVAAIEKALNIYNLSDFTPKLGNN